MRGKGGEEEKEEREGGRREGGREEREGNEKERKPVIPEANKCEIGRGREEGGQKRGREMRKGEGRDPVESNSSGRYGEL